MFKLPHRKKSRLVALMGALMFLVGVVAPAAMSTLAQAAPTATTTSLSPSTSDSANIAASSNQAAVPLAVATPASAQYKTPDHTVLGYDRFYTGSICMAIGDTSIEAGYNAQVWNNATSNVSIAASNNCVTAGYPPSRRFTIDTFNDRNRACTEVSGVDGLGTNYSLDGPVNGWMRYTNNPIAWINRACSGFGIGTVQLRHYVSQAIGLVLCLQALNSDGWNSRVMNRTLWSAENVPGPSSPEGTLVSYTYGGVYG